MVLSSELGVVWVEPTVLALVVFAGCGVLDESSQTFAAFVVVASSAAHIAARMTEAIFIPVREVPLKQLEWGRENVEVVSTPLNWPPHRAQNMS